jgi:hypothetical protein
MQEKLPPETYDAKLPDDTITILEIDGYIGSLAMESNNLEIQLQWLLATLMKSDQIAAAAAWNSVMFIKRLEVINLLNPRSTRVRNIQAILASPLEFP